MKATHALSYAACIAIGIGAGYLLNSGDEVEVPTETPAEVADRNAEVAGLEEEIEALRERAARAERDLGVARREEQARRDEADRVAAEAAAAAAAAAEVVDEETPTTIEEEIVFDISDEDPEIGAAIADVDFEAASKHVAAMVPLLERLAASVTAGEPMSPEVIGGIQKNNGPLVVVALKLSQANVPGTGANGAFSHPAVMVNAIVANLESLGHPATAAQIESIKAIGHRFVRRDRERMAGYEENTVVLRQLIDETELKTEFFADVFDVLTEKQTLALSPEATRDRTSLDLHSAGLVWAGRIEAIGFRTREELATNVERRVLRGIPEANQDTVKQMIADWVDQLPAQLLDFEADAMARQGWVPMAHVRPSAAHTLELLEKVLRDVDLPEDSRAGLISSGGAIVPHRLSDAGTE